jgi:NAD(P)-dependent dehydrogenase (short-subunit alcohol dehydrogenase family)
VKKFEGKVVIVTGGSSGIGAATALAFAREGSKVVIAARRSDKSNAMVRQIEALGSEGLFIKTDISRRAEVEAMVEGTLNRFGKLECAVNNAGIVGPVSVPMAEIEESQWDEVMSINLKGVWMCMKYEISAMLRQGKGSIVNVSSIYGTKPSDVGHAPYCTSKTWSNRSFDDGSDRLWLARHPGERCKSRVYPFRDGGPLRRVRPCAGEDLMREVFCSKSPW